jgi:3-isopropylmalate/(R)-2-methylmalate dehydratase small subunit
MRPFRKLSARVAVIDRADVDTDQIIPKQFLKRIERTGYGQYLFFDWRLDENGDPRPRFELNNPAYEGAKILLAGRNFGCGSSREHAPWALQDYGFDVVVAPSFADIFRNNCIQTGIVPIVLPDGQVRSLMDEVDPVEGAEVTVDLESCTIRTPSGATIEFDFDPFQRECLLEGLDDVARALAHEDAIAAFEAGHPSPIATTALP